MPTHSPPFHLGVWMIYEQPGHTGTILPVEGIGVYVCGLIEGLLAQPTPVRVTVLCHENGREDLEKALGEHPQLSVRSIDPPPAIPPVVPKKSRLRAALATVEHWGRCTVAYARHLWVAYKHARRPGPIARALMQRLGRLPGLAVFGCALPFLGVAFVAEAYFATTARLLLKPLQLAARLARRLNRPPAALPPPPPLAAGERLAREVGCDLWCVPTSYTSFPADLPSFLFIYDLVMSHYPDRFTRDQIMRGYRKGTTNASNAVLVGCMTEYIREVDLCGKLALPASKVRVVRKIGPANLVESVEPSPAVRNCAERPFLFYPTIFRPHKNLVQLISALAHLRRRPGLEDLTLVLTSPGTEANAVYFRQLINDLGLSEHVHILGNISRPDLAWLYQRAASTVISSTYEGIGMQLFEALECGSPLACSRIPVFQEHCANLAGVIPDFDPTNVEEIVQVVAGLLADRDAVRQRQQQAYQTHLRHGWQDVAREWLVHFREAARLAQAPRLAPVPEPLRVFLMMPCLGTGGVWEAVKDLVTTLVQINRERRQLTLTLGVTPEQGDMEGLTRLLDVDRMVIDHVPRDLTATCGIPDDAFAGEDDETKHLTVISNPAALRADAWFSLADRFHHPLYMERPFAVTVWDLIQLHYPEAFPDAFLAYYKAGILPTLRRATAVMTTNPITRQDAIDHIGLAPDAVKLFPVSCEPHHRFAGVENEPVALPRRPFLLNVNNGSPHKGIVPMIRGYAKLRERMGAATPLLVVCGISTQYFSPSYNGPLRYPPWDAVRELGRELKLEDGRDAVFLGLVSDGQLRYLFEHCALVVNSARYDNGSFNLIEGRFFGKPAVSTDYPAARWLYERFEVPVHFFGMDDADAMAEAMHAALGQPTVTAEELARLRAHLASPRYGLRHYAEAIYELLGQLATRSRQGERIEATRAA